MWVPIGLADPDDAERIARGSLLRRGISSDFSADWAFRAPTGDWDRCAHSFDFAPPLAMHAHQEGARYLGTLNALVRGWQSIAWPFRHRAWDTVAMASRVQNSLRARALLTGMPAAEPLRQSLLALATSHARRLKWNLYTIRGPKAFKVTAALALLESLTGSGRPDGAATSESKVWQLADSQLRSDGTHEEASPHTQLVILAELLELADAVAEGGRLLPLSVHVLLARALRACRLLCRPSGQPHDFGAHTHDRSPSLARVNALAARVLAVKPEAELTEMFALPSGGFAGALSHSEKLIVRCGSNQRARSARAVSNEELAFEYCLDGELLLVSQLSSRALSGLSQPSISWVRRLASELLGRGITPANNGRACESASHPLLVASRPFVFEGSHDSVIETTTFHRRIEQLGNGRWRIADWLSGAETREYGLIRFDSRWHLTRIDESCYIARCPETRGRTVRLTRSGSGDHARWVIATASKATSRPDTDELNITTLKYPISRDVFTWSITVNGPDDSAIFW